MNQTMKKSMLVLATIVMLTGGFAGCTSSNGNAVTLADNPMATPTMAVEDFTPTPEAVSTEEITPTEAVMPTDVPTEAPKVTEPPEDIDISAKAPEVTETPVITPDAEVTEAVEPTEAPTPTEMPAPTATPEPTATPASTATAAPTATPEPTATPKPTNTPKPTATPTPVPAKGIKVGDYVTFGSYPQTEITGDALTDEIVNAEYVQYDYDKAVKYKITKSVATVNGVNYYKVDSEYDGVSYYTDEPIEWKVLDVKNGKALLLAKYGLERHPYHTEAFIDGIEHPLPMTWENCALRNWLNNDFYEMAFTQKEQKSILLTKLTNPDSEYGVDGGNDTEDKVYVLSGEESLKYLGKAENRKNETAATMATDYSGIAGSSFNEWCDGNCNWWLRTPGQGVNWASFISYNGIFGTSGRYLVGGLAARPAMWIDVTTADVEVVK